MNVHAVETEGDISKVQKTFVVSDYPRKTLKDKVSFLTEEARSVSADRAERLTNFDEMTTLVDRIEDDVSRSFSNLFTEAQKMYEAIVKAANLKIQENFVEG